VNRKARIRKISTFFPEQRLTNDEIANRFEKWTSEKIFQKTGIKERRLAKETETASDFAVEAARKIFCSGIVKPSEIDILVMCTQSPDYILPSTSCLVQNRLGLSTATLAFDISLGCSGYVYGLSIIKALLENGNGSRALFLTGDTYTKYFHPMDESVIPLFGDGATATYIDLDNSKNIDWLGPFVYGTDGKGADNLIVKAGACRMPGQLAALSKKSDPGKAGAPEFLHMNGPEIFTFTLKTVPETLKRLFEKSGYTMDDIDMFVFHQANEYMLEVLRKKLKIPIEKFLVEMADTGNTVSSTIPIAIKRAIEKNKISEGMRIGIVGFGVGYSWAAGIVVL
jgi:3-oxoacyl-[acyl-carrier-protein] synthase-3